MLRIINKQAQNLTIRDDSGLLHPYRKMNNFIRDQLRERKLELKRQKRIQQFNYLEKLRNKANGICSICGQGLVKINSTGRPFCPSCRFSSVPR